MVNSSSSSIVYKLNVPLIQGGSLPDITELKFTKPKLKHLKALDMAKGDTDRLCILIEELCNITTGMVNEIDASDLEGINTIIKGFFPNAPKTP